MVSGGQWRVPSKERVLQASRSGGGRAGVCTVRMLIVKKVAGQTPSLTLVNLNYFQDHTEAASLPSHCSTEVKL